MSFLETQGLGLPLSPAFRWGGMMEDIRRGGQARADVRGKDQWQDGGMGAPLTCSVWSLISLNMFLQGCLLGLLKHLLECLLRAGHWARKDL